MSSDVGKLNTIAFNLEVRQNSFKPTRGVLLEMLAHLKMSSPEKSDVPRKNKTIVFLSFGAKLVGQYHRHLLNVDHKEPIVIVGNIPQFS